MSAAADQAFADMMVAKRRAVDDCAADIIARIQAPQDFTSRRRLETIVLALVTVPARETLDAFRASTDGEDAKAVSIPKSQIEVLLRECDGLFLVATMKAWVAIDRHMAQANMPQLAKSVAWTDDQRAGWRRIQQHTRSARSTLAAKARGQSYTPPQRKPLLTRNDAS
jgi:hypothetical protein